MYARQIVRRLGMLTTGVILGCLASIGLRSRAKVPVQAEPVRPSQGTSTGTVAQDQTRKKSRAILTNNAVVAGVVSAVVAGVISFAVAHWQSQDAARQAHAVQMADGASQVESAAEDFYDAAESLYEARRQCVQQEHPGGEVPPGCPASNVAFLNSEAVIDAAFANTSDRQTRSLLAAFTEDTADSLVEAGNPGSGIFPDKMTDGYVALIYRCAQIIQGQ